MIFLDLPTIGGGGSVEQQLAEIRSYIYKSNEQMNATLSNLTIDKIWEQTASAVGSSSDNDETPKLLSQYQRIRDLIIKTADVVVQTDEQMKQAFNGSYLAKSQFGEYLLKTSVNVEGDSTGFTDLFQRHSELNSNFGSYTSDLESYIKRGYLGEEGGLDIYGIEVGLLKNEINTVDKDGNPHTIYNSNYFRTRMTPTELGFYEGSTKVAHISSGAIHFPSAEITGGSIKIGNGTFEVDNTGKMTATSGTFSGDLTANNVKTAWNSVTGSKIELTSSTLNVYNGTEKDFSLSPSAITFYKRDGVDREMAQIKREKHNTSHWGMVLELKEGFGDYFKLQGTTKTGITYVPAGVIGSGNIYGTEGLFVNTPLHVHRQSDGTLFNTVPARTIIIPNASVDGATAQNVRIDIVNGLVVVNN